MTYMINIIRQHQYYEEDVLESMPEEEIRDLFEHLLDWLED